MSFGKKALLSAGLVVFTVGLCVAIFGVTFTSVAPSYAGSVLTFLGALVSILGLMGEGRVTAIPKRFGADSTAVKASDKK